MAPCVVLLTRSSVMLMSVISPRTSVIRFVRDTHVGPGNKEQGDNSRLQREGGRSLSVVTGRRNHDHHWPRLRRPQESLASMSELAGSVRQLGTHRKLVSRTEQRELDAELKLDAIIVPASEAARTWSRPSPWPGPRTARCSSCAAATSDPREVHELLAQRSFNDAIVVSLPDDYRHELLDFRALASIKDDLPAACSYHVTDLSTKRNLGLILARMLGWQRIFFLDDDIRDINPADVQSTVSMLGSYPRGRHASNRLSRQFSRLPCPPGDRGTCRTSSSLGRLWPWTASRTDGFFPDIYNEDWLFFYDAASAGGWAVRGVR